MRAEDYRPIVVSWVNGAAVRLADVAEPVDGLENDKVASWLGDTRAIILAVQRQPDANTVAVVDEVRALIPQIRSELPADVSSTCSTTARPRSATRVRMSSSR